MSAQQTEAEILPLRPADASAGLGPTRSTRPRAREDGTPVPREPRRLSVSLRMPSPALLTGLLQGGSLLATAAPAVLTVWQGHVAAATYYRHWWGKYPRYAYGAGHAFIEVPFLYLWAWSGHSPFLRVIVVTVLLVILRCFGIHVIWSWL